MLTSGLNNLYGIRTRCCRFWGNFVENVVGCVEKLVGIGGV